MSDLLVEENLNKARFLVGEGKNAEASDLLNTIIKNFPENQRVQSVIQQLKLLNSKLFKPSQEKINTLLKYHQNGQLINAKNLAFSFTQEFSNHPFGWKALGVILWEMGKKSDALIANQKAIEISPKDAEIHNNLGNILKDLGRFNEAEQSFKQCIKLNPKSEMAPNNLGVMLREIGKLDEAKKSFNLAIRLNPEFAVAYNNLGLTLVDFHRYKEALESYSKAIELNPKFAEAYNNLGLLLYSQGTETKTLECFSNAIFCDPVNIAYRWNFANLQVSKIYLTYKDYKKSLQQFDNELTKLNSYITTERLNETSKVIGTSFPYFLAYFENNNRYLLEKHGDICCRVMKNWQEKNLRLLKNDGTKRKKGGKIKVGIISSHVRYHSVWNHFLKGVIKSLDINKFDLHIFSLNNKSDKETESIKRRVKYFHADLKSLTEWASKISNSGLDIAFYPEIGMDKLTIQLASMRLAAIQVTSFGHPETSGLNTIDYYISSELLETQNSGNFYTEKLIKLPGLGYYFEPPTLESSKFQLSDFGIDQNIPVFLCLGAPNKFSPHYDWVYLEIIRRMDKSQFVFINDRRGLSKILKKRLKSKIEAAGFIFENHVIFVPPLNRQGYSALMKNADILLDTIGFSGANTALQAIGCGLPIITREGIFQRTRHASAILRTLGVEELIASTEEEYIDLIVKVSLNEDFRKHIRSKIKENVKLLYKNKNSICALEDFFESIGGC